jgi:hypothetical protein
MLSFISRISLLIFHLDDLSIGGRGILKFPTTPALESICTFKSFSVCLMKLGALILGAYRLIIVISFGGIANFYYYEVSFFVSFDQCKFKIYFVICIAILACFGGPLAW